MTNPKFSVVIPTRERHDTLSYALETCLRQDFDDFEIVVADNCSSPATKQVVDRFASTRIRYHRAEQPLSMQDNWNLAYSLTRGDWVTFIGDDDGLLPFGLRQLHGAVTRHNVRAVRWTYAIYSWPTIISPELANYLGVCLLRDEQILDSRQTIKDVLSGRVSPGLLPNVYHSAVARDLLEEIRGRTGRVFSGVNPDTYSSFCVAYLCKRHLSLTIPISMSGFSGNSANIAFSFVRRKNQRAEQQRAAKGGADNVRLHPWVPDLPSLWSVLFESILLAKKDLFPDDADIVPDRRSFSERLLRELPIDDLAEWPDGVAEIRRSLADDPSLVAWFDQLVRKVTPAVRPRDQFRPRTLGYADGFLHIDTAKCGISDVAGAARLASSILNYDRDDLPYDIAALVSRRPKPRTSSGIKGWLARLSGNGRTRDVEKPGAAAERD